MALTAAQNALIKDAILADPVLAAQPSDGDGLGFIAAALNAPSSPVVLAWRTDAPVSEISNGIDDTKYTPADTPLLADLPAKAAWFLNLCALITIKQMNLNNRLVGRTTINASLTRIRAGLLDAVTQVPAGANGAMTAPGGANGVNVLTPCLRNTRRIEAILAGTAQITGGLSGVIMAFEGTITGNEVDTARRS